MMKVDEEGVPLLVQRVIYNPAVMSWIFRLFDGSRVEVLEEVLRVQGITLLTYNVTPEQKADAIAAFMERWESNPSFRRSVGLAA